MRGFLIGDRGLSSSGDIHPDWSAAFADYRSIRVIGASAVGKNHIKDLRPRDDSFVIRATGNWLAASVSDGLGSHVLSRYGSSQAAEALTSYLLQSLVSDQLPLSNHPEEPDELPKTKSVGVNVLRNPKQRFSFSQLLPRKVERISSISIPDIDNSEKPKNLDRGDSKQESFVFDSVEWITGSLGFWSLPKNQPTSPGNDKHTVSAEINPPDQFEPEKLNEILHQAFKKTHKWLANRAEQFNISIRDIGCTSLGLLLNLRSGQLAVGQVGDGAMLGLTEAGEVIELIEPIETGDLTQVVPITSTQWGNSLVTKIWEAGIAFKSIYLMSDGVSTDLLYQPDREAVKNWALVMQQNALKPESAQKASTDILNWLATYEVAGSWDDRTLVILSWMK